ncbi:DUF692 domain-containing protein [Chryseobacterium sp. SSA4.19]|uniref:MNIO family chryseobactin maturase n=1 Tax=Chryseobacterium sp. SSA4.19 TaxID=2919915 RepID=UPI001F4E9BCA|nr:DUF692 family multinuclear iron-containing protein [Chryseobacterium sp. SSA4.19]MCJ8154373.1 DUF692 domain-containing protein [Chryseobacterium sp. SSA4.19]
MKPYLGLSMMAETDFVSAILPLLQNSEIEVLEWSFDTFFNAEEPNWLSNLIDFYSDNNRLIGHGVYYSLFDAKWTSRQQQWLDSLKLETQKRKYSHITEHFGFMNTENFHQGIPLPVPLCSKTLQIGKDRLSRLQNVLEIPVGLENLAFSFSADDIKQQGDFLDQLIRDIDGFLILDLHNIYCQAHNFRMDIKEIINSYPLNKVKEVHLSGGSWQESVYGKISMVRRDTHDDCIPKELFSILPFVLEKCHHLNYIIIERLGNSIKTKKEIQNFLHDFRRVRKIMDDSSAESVIEKWVKPEFLQEEPLEDLLLYQEQALLTKMLFEKENQETIRNYPFTYFNTASWDLEMIKTAENIIKKWNPY